MLKKKLNKAACFTFIKIYQAKGLQALKENIAFQKKVKQVASQHRFLQAQAMLK
jgi:hypothetical protein